MTEQRKELTGGNISNVSFDYTPEGKIIYKDLKPQSTTIHRLLQHLFHKGISFCPKPLGFDDNGHEMLSYVGGDTMEDYPPVSLITKKIEIVRQSAKMLREFHDATVDFGRQSDDAWFLSYDGDLPKEVICHNDFAPYNVTFENNLPVGLIDFDTACPAPRVWDLAYAAYRFVPLGRSDYDEAKDFEERKILLGEFLLAYGYNGDIEEYVVQRIKSLVNLFDVECAKGNQAFIKMRLEGHQDFYIQEIEFIRKNFNHWK